MKVHLKNYLRLSLITALWGCGASEEITNTLQALQGAASTFTGVAEATSQPDRSWVIRWEPANANSVIYGVYRAEEGDSFDFLTPELTTYETMYRFYQEDLLNAKPQCFVVRMLNGGFDQNTNQVCTDDEPIIFNGIDKLSRLSNGRYIVEWPEVNVPGLVFMVFEREGSANYDFSQPSYGGIRENFFRTDLQPRGQVFCYAVRYYHPDIQEDDNENEICTMAEPELVFEGIQKVEEINSSTVRVSWDLSQQSDEIAGYQVFVGSDFSELMGSTDATQTSIEVTGLAAGRQYSFGVSAVDAYGRTDTNLKILSIVMSDPSEPD